MGAAVNHRLPERVLRVGKLKWGGGVKKWGKKLEGGEGGRKLKCEEKS